MEKRRKRKLADGEDSDLSGSEDESDEEEQDGNFSQSKNRAQQNRLRQQHARATTQTMSARMKTRASLTFTHQTSSTMGVSKSTDLAIIRTPLAMESANTAATKKAHVDFLFHESCCHISAQIPGYEKSKQLAKILHGVTDGNSENINYVLHIDRKSLEGVDQYWTCDSGQEICAGFTPAHGLMAICRFLCPTMS